MLLLAGTFLFIVSVKRFEDIRFNLACAVLAFLFMAQASNMLSAIQLKPESQHSSTHPLAASSAKTNSDLKWDQGGTLQNASLDQWRMESYENRLASAADLLKGLRQKQVFKASIRSPQDYRIWAVALVACFENQTNPQESVSVLAQKCLENNGLNAYLH